MTVRGNEITLNIEEAIAKVYNVESEKWFYLINEEEDPLNCHLYLKSEDGDLYLGASLNCAPWLWGEMINLETGKPFEYRLTKEKLLERLAELSTDNSINSHCEAERLLIQYIADKEISEAYKKIPKTYY